MPQSKRATYNDIAEAQDKLRHLIDRLITEKRPLQNDKERERFIKLVRDATFGMGTETSLIVRGRQRTYNLKHMQHAAYWLAYQKDTPVLFDGGEAIEIEKLWRELRDRFFIVFPNALAMAARMSQEQTHLGAARAAKV